MKEQSKIKLQNRFTPFTSWREAKNQEGQRTTSENILPYMLDKTKALNKKISKANNQLHFRGELTIKGSAHDPQIVGQYSSATYEYLRASFLAYIEHCGSGIDICENKEASGLIVHTKVTLYNKEISEEVYYTINLYHTTNTILVNHTSAKKFNIDMFLKVYDDIMSDIPEQKTNDLNDYIKTACQEAIQELRGSSVNVDHCRPHNHCSLTWSSQNLNSDSTHAHQDTSSLLSCTGDVDQYELKNKAQSINKVIKNACKDALMELGEQSSSKRNKRAAMADYTDNDACSEKNHAKKQCHDTPSCSHWLMEYEEEKHSEPRSFGNYSSSSLLNHDRPHHDTTDQNSPPRMSTIEAIQQQLLSALERINNLERKVQNISKENTMLKKEIAQIKIQHSMLNSESPLSSSSDSPTFAQLARSLNKQAFTPSTAKPLPKRRHNIPFLPKKNIVVLVGKDGDIVANDDDIRRVIGRLDSDITIEKISRSSANCFKKFCVQLSDERMVDSALTKWSSDLFGSSSARKVMQQSSAAPKSIGVIKGVPFFIADEQLCADLEDGGFGRTTVKRIHKGIKPTRAVKVYFDNHELLTKAITDRVRAQGLTFTVDTFNQSAVVRCYNCHQFKHTAASCPNSKKCHNCSETYHGDNCQEIAKCVNCKGNHRSSSVQCPVYVKLHNTILNRASHVSSSSSITSC